MITVNPSKFSVALFVFGFAVCLPAVGFGEEDALEGTYKLDGAEAQVQDKIHQAIEELVEDVNFVKRSFARKRLRATNEAAGQVKISLDDDDIGVRFDDDPPAVSPRGNKPAKWTNEEGETYELTQKISGRTVTQKFASDEGARTNELTVSEDGNTIDLKVTVTSDQLPRPLTYNLSYSSK